MKDINSKVFSIAGDEKEIQDNINDWLDKNKAKEILQTTVVKYFLIIFYSK
jgi:hypothetical protein